MTILLREIQAADRLSFTEMSVFRSAVKRGIVPGPTRKLPIGRRRVDVWSSDEIDEFIVNARKEQLNSVGFDDDIAALA